MLRPRRTHAQGLAHPHQIRQRLRSHLLHDATAMDLDRDLAQPEFAGACLFINPEATMAMISRSRGVRVSKLDFSSDEALSASILP